MISLHIVPFQKNFIFYNRDFKCIEQGVFRIQRVKFCRYYVLNLEKCVIVFKLLASNCMLRRYIVRNMILNENLRVNFFFFSTQLTPKMFGLVYLN